MKTRTCPNCGYQYSRMDYIKKLWNKFLGDSWECPNCKQKITFDMKRRILVVIFFGLWIIVVNTAKSYLEMDTLMWITLPLIFLIGTIFIFTFDTFKKAND